MTTWANSAAHRQLVAIRNQIAELQALDLARIETDVGGMASARIGAARARLRDAAETLSRAIAVLPPGT